MSFDWKSLVKGIAPVLGTALGGPLGGAAAAALANKLSPDKPVDPSDDGQMTKLIQSAAATPDQLLKIQQAEEEFKLSMEKLGLDHEEAMERFNLQTQQTDASDRANARQRQIDLKDWTPTVLAAAVTIGFFGVLGWMLHKPVPEDSRDVINIMLGSLGTAWISIISFYFGSSASSARKDVMLANSTPVK
jgi:hypothetical protein